MDLNILLTQLQAAAKTHAWILFIALLVGALLALIKQGWLGAWLKAKIPSRYIPLYALALSELGLMSADIIGGKTWQQALQDGFAAAMLAVFGHETLIEMVRNGKEIVPAYKATPSTPSTPKNDSNANTLPPANTPPEGPVMKKYNIYPSRFRFIGLAVLASFVVLGCKTLQAVFTDTEVACQVAFFTQSLIPPNTPAATVANDIALGCGIADNLIPDIEKVVQAYEASQANDAGAATTVTEYKPAPFVAAKKLRKSGKGE
jgi:hypothetical protein